MAQYASSVSSPVAWYRAEATDGRADTVIAYLAAAIGSAVGKTVPDDSGVIGLVHALEAISNRQLLLMVDDLHTLEGTEADRVFERLLELAPTCLHMLATARRAPPLNLARLRLDGSVLDVDAGDLRFRSWEVEKLFAVVYQEPMPPEDLAVLARRTEGWAAGLQLFHLSTTGKPPVERSRAVAALAVDSRLVRGYLTQNVLADIPGDLRSFLVETSVLGRLTPGLCDQLRGARGSAALLAEAARRQLFLVPLEDPESYRVHEVLRSHLEALLVAGVGGEESKRLYRRAGSLLELSDALPEALVAYSRAGEPDQVRRLLAALGGQIDAEPGHWLDMLPAEMSEHDPWLVRAAARRAVADGRLSSAVQFYKRAEEQFGSSPPGDDCRRSRAVAARWADASSLPGTHWSEPLRQALQRNPAAEIRPLTPADPPERQLVQALVRVLYGQLPDARLILERLPRHPLASAWLQSAAELGSAFTLLLAGQTPPPLALLRSARRAEDAELPWLARLARAMAAAGAEPPRHAELEAIHSSCVGLGDLWGAGAVLLVQALATLREGADPRPAAAAAEVALQRVGAAVLASVAVGVAAVGAARDGDQDSALLVQARAVGRATGSRWSQLLAALAGGDPHIDALAADCGVDPQLLSVALLDGADSSVANSPSYRVQCLGGFSVWGPAGEISLAGLKPRSQDLLRLLCSRPGQLVHRDELVQLLWPQAEESSGLHLLHVAVSSLRRFFATTMSDSQILARESSAYRIATPDRIDVDVQAFEQAVAASRRLTAPSELLEVLQEAVALYQGDLFPATTDDWVLDQRDFLKTQAAEVAHELGARLLAHGRSREAVLACRFGLRADRYRDDLWRQLIEALACCEDLAAQAKAELGYRSVLTELGVAAAARAG